jgi:hypothetical protein
VTVDTGRDVLLRSSLALAAAVLAFALVVLAWRLRLRPSRRDVLFAALIFWLAFLASAAPIAASALGRAARDAFPFTLALYFSAAASAALALRRRAPSAVLAAVVAVIFRTLLNILFAAAYAFVIE